ncbi:MAG: helix-turn-helix domain-containing protein [Clostridium sp.]|nr:MAG: helix-turn-helix domain-containing protein [Clostridium sp.]
MNKYCIMFGGDEYYGSDRVVDDLLRRLRQKLPNLNVETIYGYGYRLK